MKEFSQLLQDYMTAYGHDVALLAESTGKRPEEIQNILSGATVPVERYAHQLAELYHIEGQELSTFLKSWHRSRLKWVETCNKVERQMHAYHTLPSLNLTEDATPAERIVFVLVASQYYYNTIHSVDLASEIGQEIIEIRNLIVYNYGSAACERALIKLNGPDYVRYVEDVKRRILP